MTEIEKVIEVLKNTEHYIKFDYEYLEIETPLKKAIDLAITALEAQKADMWIPISSNLPEIEDEYIVTLENGDVDFDIFNGGKWTFWNGIKYGMKVIAWREKPKPWKEEQ